MGLCFVVFFGFYLSRLVIIFFDFKLISDGDINYWDIWGVRRYNLIINVFFC